MILSHLLYSHKEFTRILFQCMVYAFILKNRIGDILHLVILFHFKSQWVSHNSHPLDCSIFYRRTVPTLRRRILCILRKDGSLTGFLKQHLIIALIESWLCGHELKMNKNSLHAKSRAWISLHGILNFLAIQQSNKIVKKKRRFTNTQKCKFRAFRWKERAMGFNFSIIVRNWND